MASCLPTAGDVACYPSRHRSFVTSLHASLRFAACFCRSVVRHRGSSSWVVIAMLSWVLPWARSGVPFWGAVLSAISGAVPVTVTSAVSGYVFGTVPFAFSASSLAPPPTLSSADSRSAFVTVSAPSKASCVLFPSPIQALFLLLFRFLDAISSAYLAAIRALPVFRALIWPLFGRFPYAISSVCE